MQRKQDKALLPICISILLGCVLLGVGAGLLWGGFAWVFGPLFGLSFGVLGAMFIFARRVQSNVYKQADGNPGAAAWSLPEQPARQVADHARRCPVPRRWTPCTG